MSLSPLRIARIDRIISNIRIEVDLVVIADRVDLQEPSPPGAVDAGLVVEAADLGQPDLAGVAEPAEVGGVGDAIFVVGVGLDQRARRIGDGDDAALLVGEEVAAGGQRGSFVPGDGIVDPGAMDVAAQDNSRRVIFGDELVAVVDQPSGVGPARAGSFVEPSEWVLDQAAGPAAGEGLEIQCFKEP